MSRFSKKELEEFKDCFTLHDKDGSERIPVQQLGVVVRSLGKCPTEDLVMQIARAVVKKDTFNLQDLVNVMETLQSQKEYTEEDYRESFKAFDREGMGYVSAAELRHVMTNLGEKLTDEEVDEMLQAVEMDGNGQLNYEEMVNSMMTK